MLYKSSSVLCVCRIFVLSLIQSNVWNYMYHQDREARPDTMIRCRYIDLAVNKFVAQPNSFNDCNDSTTSENSKDAPLINTQVVTIVLNPNNSTLTNPNEPNYVIKMMPCQVLLGAGMDTRAYRLPNLSHTSVLLLLDSLLGLHGFYRTCFTVIIMTRPYRYSRSIRSRCFSTRRSFCATHPSQQPGSLESPVT